MRARVRSIGRRDCVGCECNEPSLRTVLQQCEVLGGYDRGTRSARRVSMVNYLVLFLYGYRSLLVSMVTDWFLELISHYF